MKTLLFVSTVTLGLIFTSCSNAGDQKQNTSSDTENHQHSDNNVYSCPMHPEITGKEGDKCSKCGMDLVAVSDETQD